MMKEILRERELLERQFKVCCWSVVFWPAAHGIEPMASAWVLASTAAGGGGDAPCCTQLYPTDHPRSLTSLRNPHTAWRTHR